MGFLLHGTRSNRDGIGARVEITSCGQTQFETVRNGGGYLSRNDPRVHFEMGPCNKPVHTTIKWPSGTAQEIEVPVNRYTTIEEPR